MPKTPIVRTLLFAGACTLGVAAFVGGFKLRGATDPLVRLAARPPDSEGYVASREDSEPIPLGDFYAALSALLKEKYVEPIKDDQKLASGAVRGMVVSLGDPRCVFMDKDEFRAFLNAREGRYEGIGAEFAYQGSAAKPKPADPNAGEAPDDAREAVLSSHVPYLAVTMVAPGGPADRAGVKPGDVVAGVDGHWVVDDAEIVRFNGAVKAFAAKKIPYSAVAKLLSDLKKKSERALMPAKAKDRLVLGEAGAITVVWKRNGVERTTKLVKAPSKVSLFAIKGGAYAFRFDAETPARLRTALKGKSAVTLDLRGNVDGDYDAMVKTLAVIAPTGTYGTIATRKKEVPMLLTVTSGNPNPPKISLLVDETTQGPAAILARALASRHRATLVGGPTGPDLSTREVVALPDGTGYTLVTGEYRTGGGPTKVALKDTSS